MVRSYFVRRVNWKMNIKNYGITGWKSWKKNLKIKQLFKKIVILYLECIYWFSEKKLFQKAAKILKNPEKIEKQWISGKTYCMKRILEVWEFEKIQKPGEFTVKHIISESIWKKAQKYEKLKKIRKKSGNRMNFQ